MRFTFGLISRKNIKATEDAEIVTALKNVGAILVGVTNVPELNLWCETRNFVYGQTNNPYDFNRTTGGSSGGEVCNPSIPYGATVFTELRALTKPVNFFFNLWFSLSDLISKRSKR